MDPATKASLLWGTVAALAFLVGYQALLLSGSDGVAVPAVAVVTLAVFGGAAGLSHVVAAHLSGRNEQS